MPILFDKCKCSWMIRIIGQHIPFSTTAPCFIYVYCCIIQTPHHDQYKSLTLLCGGNNDKEICIFYVTKEKTPSYYFKTNTVFWYCCMCCSLQKQLITTKWLSCFFILSTCSLSLLLCHKMAMINWRWSTCTGAMHTYNMLTATHR